MNQKTETDLCSASHDAARRLSDRQAAAAKRLDELLGVTDQPREARRIARRQAQGTPEHGAEFAAYRAELDAAQNEYDTTMARLRAAAAAFQEQLAAKSQAACERTKQHFAQPRYGKNKRDEWVVVGLANDVRVGCLQVITADGRHKTEEISRVGQAFTRDGVELRYGYLARVRYTTPTRRPTHGQLTQCDCCGAWGEGHDEFCSVCGA